MESYKVAITDKFGNIVGFKGIDHDVTELEGGRKKISEELSQISKLNGLMVDRELKMIELKNEIEDLRSKLSQKNN
jgi:hypothetical protein